MKYGIKSPYNNILGTGLRKVINSLVSAVKNIDSKSSVLGKLGIKKSEIVDDVGKFEIYWYQCENIRKIEFKLKE